MGNVRDVLPMELLGKRNAFSARNTGDLAYTLVYVAILCMVPIVGVQSTDVFSFFV